MPAREIKPYDPTPKFIEKFFTGIGEGLRTQGSPEACGACNCANCSACQLAGLGKVEADALAAALTAQAMTGSTPYDKRFLKDA